jgi:glucose dehydrogenase
MISDHFRGALCLNIEKSLKVHDIVNNCTTKSWSFELGTSTTKKLWSFGLEMHRLHVMQTKICQTHVSCLQITGQHMGASVLKG